MRQLPAYGLSFVVIGVFIAACSRTETKDSSVGRFVDGQVLVLESQPVRRIAVPDDATRAWQTLRFEAFGPAILRLQWEDGTRDGSLRIEGPLSESTEEAPGLASSRAESRGASLDVALPQAGVYRVLATATNDRPRLRAQCDGACARPTIYLAELLESLAVAGREALSERVEAYLSAHVTDPWAVQRFVRRWREAIALPRLRREVLDRIMTIPPFRQTIAFRPLLGRLGGPEPRPMERLDVELTPFLDSTAIPPVRPAPLDPRLTDRMGFDHFRSRALPSQVLRGSIALGRLLGALAAGGSRVRVTKEDSVDSVEAFARWLLSSGHEIELRSDRTYANFLSLTWDDANVRWPVWLDTGLGLSDGTRLVVPTGHSQFTWSIRGPRVNGDFGFYLGSTNGAGFFPRIDVRPEWARMKTIEAVFSSDEAGRRRILDTFSAAATYLRRVRQEAATVARGMAADGYGYLGICNDATAVLQASTGQPVDVYPVVRAAELLHLSPVRDSLEAVLRRLPNDADSDPGGAPYARDALCRALRMSPFPLDSPRLLDERLGNQLRRAATDLGNACPLADRQ